MSREQFNLQKGFVLHRREYRETSLLLDVFTVDQGRFTVVAKGARSRRAKSPGLYEPFSPMFFSWSGHADLPTLTHSEVADAPLILFEASLFCGFYLNELLLRLLPQRDPHPEVFELYRKTLAALSAGFEERILRAFEFQLLTELGYGLRLDSDVYGNDLGTEGWYDYIPGEGLMPAKPADGRLLGRNLMAMARRELEDPAVLHDAKRLLRRLLQHYLGTQPLKSRLLFRDLHSTRDRCTHTNDSR